MTPKVLTCSHFEQSFLYEISEKGPNHHYFVQGYNGKLVIIWKMDEKLLQIN